MKRNLKWLVLPILLGALMWGVKWRADHPTPTKLDLEIRSSMLKCPKVEVVRYEMTPIKLNEHRMKISKKELQSLMDSFYLSPQITRKDAQPVSANKIVGVAFLAEVKRKYPPNGVFLSINLDKEGGTVTYRPSKQKSSVYDIHPATINHWAEFLLNHPHIGPELRQRMEQSP